MDNSHEAGKTIYNAVNITIKAWKEVDAMIGELEPLLGEYLQKEKIIKYGGFAYDKNNDSEKPDQYGWTYLSYLYNFSLTSSGQGKRSPFGYLGFQVDMYNEDLEQVGIDEAIMHVLYATGTWEIDQFTLPPAIGMRSWDDYEDSYHCELLDQRLWDYVWEGKEKDPQKGCWAFSLPLTVLNTPDDLNNQIVEPVTALLKGKSAAQAFSTADKVIRYEGDSEKCKKLEIAKTQS